MPSSTDKANLARIRDNQRRSRARRKEYLQELENKFRNCQLIGVEASAEIQSAARKVFDENKQLRLLLKQKGIEEDEINAFLAGNSHDIYHSDGPVLDILLKTRKSCDGSLSSSKCADTSTADDSNAQANRNYPSGSEGYIHLMQRASLAHQFVDGNAPGSRSSTKSPGLQSSIPYKESLEQEFIVSQPFADPEYHVDPYQDKGAGMSCADAANMVAALDPSISREAVSTELGCTPGSCCTVDNTTIFGVMDKYTTDGLGI